MANPADDEKIEHTNPRDEVADDVRSAIASLKGDAPEEAEAPPEPEAPAEGEEPAVETAAEERPRGPDGKFLPKEAVQTQKDAAPAKAAAPESKITPPSDNTAKASAPQPSTAALAPPVSWAADAKAQWATLPPAIQTAVLKREREASDGFAQYSDKVRRYETAIAPIAQLAQQKGMAVEEGIQRLASAQAQLDHDPRGAIAFLAKSYGVDLADLAQNPPAFQQQARTETVVHPQVLTHISSLEERLNSILMDQNMSAVEQFAQANPHYADVEEQLPAFMREVSASNPALKGTALLQAAYDRAIWLNPDVRAKVQAEQVAQTTQQRVAQVAEKATRASKAAVSIRGSSVDSRPPPKRDVNGSGHVTDDVRDAIAQLRAQ